MIRIPSSHVFMFLLQNYDSAKQICSNVGLATIFAECLEVTDASRFRQMCEYDMCAYPSRRVAVCSMMAALSHACHERNIEVKWQSYGVLDYCRGKSYGVLDY